MVAPTIPRPRMEVPLPHRRSARDLLVITFAVVELDRLLGSVIRLSGVSFGPSHIAFGVASWRTALDLTTVVIAAASLVFVSAHFRTSPLARPLGTITLTAAAHHTLLIL